MQVSSRQAGIDLLRKTEVVLIGAERADEVLKLDRKEMVRGHS